MTDKNTSKKGARHGKAYPHMFFMVLGIGIGLGIFTQDAVFLGFIAGLGMLFVFRAIDRIKEKP